MKFNFFKYSFILMLLAGSFFTSCRSPQPAFQNNPGTATETAAANKTTQALPPAQTLKTVADSTKKLVYDSTKVSFKIKYKTEVETKVDPDDGEEEITSSKAEIAQKYRKREKEKGKWLSGGFLAAGMALLLTSLVLVIIGSGPAGLLAIIGGALFFAGFIFTMLALLGR